MSSSSSSYLTDGGASDDGDIVTSPECTKSNNESSPGFDDLKKAASTPRTTNVSNNSGKNSRPQSRTRQTPTSSPPPTSLASTENSSTVLLVEGIATNHCIQSPPMHSNKAIVVSNPTARASPSVAVVPFYERWNQDFVSLKSALDDSLQNMVEVSQHEMDLLSASVAPRAPTRVASILSSLEQPRPEPRDARMGIRPMSNYPSDKPLSPWYEKSRFSLPTQRGPTTLTPPSMLDVAESNLQRPIGLVSSPTMNTTSPSCRSGRTNRSDTTEPQSNMTQHVQERRQQLLEQKLNDKRRVQPAVTHHILYHHRSASSWSSGGNLPQHTSDDASQIRHSQTSMDFAIPEEEQTLESTTVGATSVGRITPTTDREATIHEDPKRSVDSAPIGQRSEDEEDHEIVIITSQDEAAILASQDTTSVPSPQAPPQPQRLFFPDNLDDDSTDEEEVETNRPIDHATVNDGTDDENEEEKGDCLSPLASTVSSSFLNRVAHASGELHLSDSQSTAPEHRLNQVPSNSDVSGSNDNNDTVALAVSPSGQSSSSVSSWALQMDPADIQSSTNFMLTASTPSTTISALTVTPSLLAQSRTRPRKSPMYRLFDTLSERRQGWKYPNLFENAQKKMRDAPQLNRSTGNPGNDHRRTLSVVSFDRPDAPDGSTDSDAGELYVQDAPSGNRSVASSSRPMAVHNPATPTPSMPKAPNHAASTVVLSQPSHSPMTEASRDRSPVVEDRISSLDTYHQTVAVSALTPSTSKAQNGPDRSIPSPQQSVKAPSPLSEQSRLSNKMAIEKYTPTDDSRALTVHRETTVARSPMSENLTALLGSSSTKSIRSISSKPQDFTNSASLGAENEQKLVSSGSLSVYSEWETHFHEEKKDDSSQVLGRVFNQTEHVTNMIISDPYGDQGSFTGVLVRGKPDSYGTMIYQDGRVYSGSWKRGKWDGHGQVIFTNGDTYTGDYARDQRHGVGRYEWSDGRVYDGRFERDQRHGHGIYSWSDGSLYSGEFHNGVRHGVGIFTYPDGSVYNGTWREGKQNGHGECVWADGRCFRGDWVDGHARFGVEVRADGSIRHSGIWKNDRPVRKKSNPKSDDQKPALSTRRDVENRKVFGDGLDKVANKKRAILQADAVSEITDVFQASTKQIDRIGQEVSYKQDRGLKNLISSPISNSVSELSMVQDKSRTRGPIADASNHPVPNENSTSCDELSLEPLRANKKADLFITTTSKKTRIASQHRDRTAKQPSDQKVAAWIDSKDALAKSKHARVAKESRAAWYTNQLLHSTSPMRPESSIAMLLNTESRESSEGDVDSGVIEDKSSMEFDYCRQSFKSTKKSSRLLRYQLKMKHATCR